MHHPAITNQEISQDALQSDSDIHVPNTETPADEPDIHNEQTREKRGFAFWCIIFVLCVTSILSSLEGTITSTALPTIVSEVGGNDLYLWTVNGYYLTFMMFQPLYGQMANIFGRRWLMIFAITIFIIGSTVCGASQDIYTLIVGRAIQGIGGGGLTMLTNLIISDIVPLRERGNFMAYLYAAITVGTGAGPFIGGAIVQRVSWRWVFFLNLPIGGLALLLTVVFLQVGYKKEATIWHGLKRIDIIGNAILAPSLVAILLALTWGGTTLPWSSWRVILPIVLGFLGLGLFAVFESSKYCTKPTVPPRLFTNRTSTAGFILTFIQSGLMYWCIYFLPVFFQGVYGSSPSRSGIQLFPFVLILVPSAIASGRMLSRVGRYRPFHWIGFSFVMIGLGCFTLLRRKSSTAAWVCFQGIVGAGLGLIAPTTLPAIMAPLAEEDVAAATGTWSFMRSFGIIWGITIPGAVFNNRFAELATSISDPATRAQLLNGGAYEHATKAFVDSFSDRPILQAQIISDYTMSLQRIWQVAIGFAGLAFMVVFLEKDIALRTSLNTKFGIKEKDESKESVVKLEEGRREKEGLNVVEISDGSSAR